MTVRRFLVKWTIRPVLIAFIVLITLILVQAFASRRMLPLEPWHREPIESEFTEADYSATFDLEDYLAREKQVFAELSRYLLDRDDLKGHSLFCRYVRGGPQDPARQSPDWNRTREIAPDDPKRSF